MNLSDIWDWAFFWTMFRNFAITAASFVMIIVAINAVGNLISVIIKAVRNKGGG